jgi:uncharacterized membrane protein
MSLTSVVAEIIASAIIVAPVLWLVGRALIGKDKAKLTHALWIVVLGVIIGAVLGMFIQGTLGLIITLIVWVYLIKHFFETGWGKAIVVGIIALIVLAIVMAVLAIVLGLTVGALFGF